MDGWMDEQMYSHLGLINVSRRIKKSGIEVCKRPPKICVLSGLDLNLFLSGLYPYFSFICSLPKFWFCPFPIQNEKLLTGLFGKRLTFAL